jgi:Peptidase family M28/WD40-like Beta Propeller Repeat
MTRRFSTALLLFALLAPGFGLSGNAGTHSESLLQIADLAWERGDYPAALRGYLRLLDSADADAVLEPIALRTGEWYRSIELTSDGAAPQFSADGRHFLYETGPVATRRTRVVATGDPTRVVVELAGGGASFTPDGAKVAYWKETRATVHELASGREITLDPGKFAATSLVAGTGETIVFVAATDDDSPAQLHRIGPSRPIETLTTDATDKVIVAMNSTGTALLFTTRAPGAGRGGRGGAGAATTAGGRGTGSPAAAPSFNVLSLLDGTIATIAGSSPSFSPDGTTIAYVHRTSEGTSLLTLPASHASAAPTVVRTGTERLDFPAISPDGNRLAFQMMSREDWDLFIINRDGTGETRLTRDVQHDVLPQFLSDTRLIGVLGEARHRRAFLYDLATGSSTRLFHNNTVRTIAPEYSWKVGSPSNPSANKLLLVAERDGDTVSIERGVYLVDLANRVTLPEVRARIAASLAAEDALRAKGARLFAPIADAVRALVADVSVERIYGYEKTLFDFDSKHISRPGNQLAATYLFETYKSFGYSPQFQWFERATALGGKTANVVATLKGTVNPELVYVVSSHYDSAAISPGADDDSSGTAVLLETARVMAQRPQPATIVFASFTGEEAGLLGSREFVRRAVADKLAVVGALNNDMVGWANDQRLDSTIRYSNTGIRDIQHTAAIQFTDLITYDALYYKSTDAAAYYEAFGDIVGGIGSYPVLSSPHYHQSHDVLENINHRLVTEVAKTTVATVALLASSPSRLVDVKLESINDTRGTTGTTATVTWRPSPERGVTTYLISYGPPSAPDAHQLRVSKPIATLTNVGSGWSIAVKAINANGLEGWDWARVTVK